MLKKTAHPGHASIFEVLFTYCHPINELRSEGIMKKEKRGLGGCLALNTQPASEVQP